MFLRALKEKKKKCSQMFLVIIILSGYKCNKNKNKKKILKRKIKRLKFTI